MSPLITHLTKKYSGPTSITPPPLPELEGELPRRIATGLGLRNNTAENQKTLALVQATKSGFVTLETSWKALHLADGELDEVELSRLISEMDRLYSLGLGAPIRCLGGFKSPDWVRALCGGPAEGGGFILYSNDGNLTGDPSPSDPSWKALPNPCLAYWHPNAIFYYRQFLSLLPPKLLHHPACCGLTFFLPTTQYVEPGVQQLVNVDNRNNMLAAGYTREGQKEAWIAGLKAHGDILKPQKVATMVAFNPIQQISDTGKMASSTSLALEMMDYFVSVCGRTAVIENNSHQTPQRKYPTMYEKMKTLATRVTPFPVACWLQTETGASTELLYDGSTPTIRTKVGPEFQMSSALTDFKVTSFELFRGSENPSVIKNEEESKRSGLPIGTVRWLGVSVASAGEFNQAAWDNSKGKHDYYTIKEGTIPDPDPKPDPKPTETYFGKVGWSDDGSLAAVSPGTSTCDVPPSWAINNGMGFVNFNVGLKELVNVGATTTTYKAGSLESALADLRTWNSNNPSKKVKVALRLHVGERAPDEWKTRCGTVDIADESFGKYADIPKWWDGPYRALYTQAMAALAPAVKAIPEIKCVNVPGAAYFYPEPMILLPGAKKDNLPATLTNRENLLAAGWTAEKHRTFLKWLPSTVSVWERVVVYLALNPVNFGGADGTDYDLMIEVANAHIAALPAGQAGLENYSIRESFITGTGSMQNMYTFMGSKSPVAWISAQCARTPRIAIDPVNNQVWDDIGVYAIGKKFHGLETSGPARKNDDDVLCTANAWPEAYQDDGPGIFNSQNNAFKGIPAPVGGDEPLPDDDPNSVRKISGVVGWMSTSNLASLQQVVSAPYIGGLSGFCRWDDFTTDGVTFNWDFFDKVNQAAEEAEKNWAAMVIHGNTSNGLPSYVYSDLPSDEMITADNGTFPAFWSAKVRERKKALTVAFKDRYGAKPYFAQWRITGSWSTHGEPWFMGGVKGQEEFTKKWNSWCARTGNGTSGWAGLVEAYQAYEKSIWLEAASIMPKYIALSQAAGDALKDVDNAKPHTDPLRHPDRYETWGQIRTTLGSRFVAQFNGAGPGDGASGYITWLASSFGPKSSRPSRLIAQPVGGVTTGKVRLSASEFVTMLNTLVTKGYSAFEFYQADALAATDPSPVGDGLIMKNAVIANKDKWRP